MDRASIVLSCHPKNIHGAAMVKSIEPEGVRHRRSISILIGVVGAAVNALPFAIALWTAERHEHVSGVESRDAVV